MSLLSRFKRGGGGDASAARLRRRKAIFSAISRLLPAIIPALFFFGYAWMMALPAPQLGRWTYIDENALGPGQVNAHWNWAEVHIADQYLAQLEQFRNGSTGHERARFIQQEFTKLGIPAATQSYEYLSSVERGINTYAVLSSPRTSSTEAIVISASWRSISKEHELNLRGVATLLSLAAYLKQYSLWSKDLVFVVSDGNLAGMNAWLAAYHGQQQSNLVAETLTLSSGVVWTALNIDYPGHSFSHLGIFYEGTGGRLCNQDLINSFQRVAHGYVGVPVVLYDHLEDDTLAKSLPFGHYPAVQTFAYQARNILRHIGYQARGRPSGVHGLFHQYRISAFTLFAVPAVGPHGFHSIGRAIEPTLRTMNNLLERLHASFYFYVMTGPVRFIQIGNYLPSAVLVAVAMIFSGLRLWVQAGWAQVPAEKGPRWEQRKRPVLPVLFIMLGTHMAGALLFWIVNTHSFAQYQHILSPIILAFMASFLAITARVYPISPSASLVLKAFNLCVASMIISVTSVVNFSLAASLAVTLGLPLALSPHGGSKPKWVQSGSYIALGLGWILATNQVREAIWYWEILGVWFAPFVCIIYTPIVLQAAIVCLLPA